MLKKFSLSLCCAVVATASALAQIEEVPFAGNHTTGVWYLDNIVGGPGNNQPSEYGNTGSYPGFTMWNPLPVYPTDSTDTDTVLKKIANGSFGGPYLTAARMYFGAATVPPNTLGGTLAVSDSTPLTSLRTIGLQIYIGMADGYDFYNEEFPLLFINGESAGREANFNFVIWEEAGDIIQPDPEAPEVQLYDRVYYFQWSFADSVEDFEIEFSAVAHSYIYGMQIDQSDVFYHESMLIPEPSTWALMGAGVAGLYLLRRRRAVA